MTAFTLKAMIQKVGEINTLRSGVGAIVKGCSSSGLFVTSYFFPSTKASTVLGSLLSSCDRGIIMTRAAAPITINAVRQSKFKRRYVATGAMTSGPKPDPEP